MFCCLYKMSERTDISLHKFKVCDKNCSDYIFDNKCKICYQLNEKLTPEHFGWMIESLILFNIPRESKSKNTKYISCLSLIHPSESDIYIIFCQKHDKKKDEWYSIYKYFQNNDIKEFENLSALNMFLKKIGYNGRKLTDSDLLIGDKKCTQ